MTPQNQMNEDFRPAELIPEVDEQEDDTPETPDERHDAPIQPSANLASQIPSDDEDMIHVEGQETMILTIKPSDLSSGSMSIRELTQMAGGLQDLADSIANTIYNQPSEKGKIPEDILETTKMILSAIQPDAFQAVLGIKHPQQTSLEKPDVVATLQELFCLFEASNDADQLADKIAALGPRTFRIYADWTKAIAESKTPVHIAWHSAYNETAITAFDAEKAGRIYQILANVSNTNEDMSVKGTFTGANVRTGTFELITEKGERISGPIIRDAMADFTTIKFNQTYTVELLKMSVTGPDINDKTAWTLKDMTPA